MVHMDLTRRTVLFGLGATGFAGNSVLFGAGAFSSAEAERSVAVTVADDRDAVLSFEINPPIGEQILDTASSGGVTTIKFEQNSLNQHATTLFQNALKVTNRGAQNVGFSVDASESDDPNGLLGNALDVRDGTDPGTSIVDPGTGTGAVDLDADGSIDLTVAVDLREHHGSDLTTINSVVFAARQRNHGGS